VPNGCWVILPPEGGIFTTTAEKFAKHYEPVPEWPKPKFAVYRALGVALVYRFIDSHTGQYATGLGVEDSGNWEGHSRNECTEERARDWAEYHNIPWPWDNSPVPEEVPA
jgi:hypothetical protein